jgi:hypothetical protein
MQELPQGEAEQKSVSAAGFFSCRARTTEKTVYEEPKLMTDRTDRPATVADIKRCIAELSTNQQSLVNEIANSLRGIWTDAKEDGSCGYVALAMFLVSAEIDEDSQEVPGDQK